MRHLNQADSNQFIGTENYWLHKLSGLKYTREEMLQKLEDERRAQGSVEAFEYALTVGLIVVAGLALLGSVSLRLLSQWAMIQQML